MLTWEAPSLREIDMNAEIGAYQEDFDPPGLPILLATPIRDLPRATSGAPSGARLDGCQR